MAASALPLWFSPGAILQPWVVLAPPSYFQQVKGWHKIKTLLPNTLCSMSGRIPTGGTSLRGLPGKFRVPLSADGGLGSFLFVPRRQPAHRLWVDGFHWWSDTDNEAWLCPLGCFPEGSWGLLCDHFTAATLGSGWRQHTIHFILPNLCSLRSLPRHHTQQETYHRTDISINSESFRFCFVNGFCSKHTLQSGWLVLS